MGHDARHSHSQVHTNPNAAKSYNKSKKKKKKNNNNNNNFGKNSFTDKFVKDAV